MRGCYINTVTGEVETVFSIQDGITVPESEDPSKQLITHIPEEVDLNCYFDISTASFAHKGQKPSRSHVWDTQQRGWVHDTNLAWQDIKITRNKLLADSDWTDMVSAQVRIKKADLDKWEVYRQALRDITIQADPMNINWPSKPVQG